MPMVENTQVVENLTSIVTNILVLSVLIVIHEFGHFIAARKAGVRVEAFSLGFGKKLFVKKGKETEYSVSIIPLGGYVKLAGDNLDDKKGAPDEYLSKPIRKRFAIVFLGPLMNYALGFFLLCFAYYSGYPLLFTKIGEIQKGSSAEAAGLKAGDMILAVDSKKVETWFELKSVISKNAPNNSSQVVLTIERGNIKQDIPVAIQVKKEQDSSESRSIGIIAGDVKPGLGKSFSLGAKKTVDITWLTYRALGMMISGKLSFKESTSGVIGVYIAISVAKKIGFIAVIYLTAVLSISLALINLLPFPALDGGHILLMGIEKIRGKYLGKKAEDVINKVGFSFLILLMVAVTYNDLDKFGFVGRIGGLFGKIAHHFVK
jgi:regulator of sigma E protease